MHDAGRILVELGTINGSVGTVIKFNNRDQICSRSTICYYGNAKAYKLRLDGPGHSLQFIPRRLMNEKYRLV